MRVTRLVIVLIATLLPLSALANTDSEPRPRWDREAYRTDRSMPADNRRWEHMNGEEREEVRRRKHHYDSLPPRAQSRLRNAHEEFEWMSPDRRREMRERWERMPPEEKERYRLEREMKREMRRESRH